MIARKPKGASRKTERADRASVTYYTKEKPLMRDVNVGNLDKYKNGKLGRQTGISLLKNRHGENYGNIGSKPTC
jgi:hypothetical protein